MRALTRMRTLAAACALLLTLAGTAAANAPGRPIDRPDSPQPPTTEAGEPDTGSNLTSGGYRLFWYAAWISNPVLGQIPFPLSWFRAGSGMTSLMRLGRR